MSLLFPTYLIGVFLAIAVWELMQTQREMKAGPVRQSPPAPAAGTGGEQAAH